MFTTCSSSCSSSTLAQAYSKIHHDVCQLPPVTSNSDSLGSAYDQQQLPLWFVWSITTHKSQGLTLSKAWIDLGTTEMMVAGLPYVALSRVRKLDDLVIEPMTLEDYVPSKSLPIISSG